MDTNTVTASMRLAILLYLESALQVFECGAKQWFGELHLLLMFN